MEGHEGKMAKVVTARDMLMSIILCTHRSDWYNDLVDAINSLDAQNYNNLEIVVVVDGNRAVSYTHLTLPTICSV